jgi:extradiol dioxygenase family protein
MTNRHIFHLSMGTEDEHGKLYLSDPSGNVIELKAYRDLERTLGLRPT